MHVHTCLQECMYIHIYIQDACVLCTCIPCDSFVHTHRMICAHLGTLHDSLLPRTVLLALVVVALNGVFTLEQPEGSFLEFFWRFRWLLQQVGMEAVTRLHVRDASLETQVMLYRFYSVNLQGGLHVHALWKPSVQHGALWAIAGLTGSCQAWVVITRCFHFWVFRGGIFERV